MRKRVAAKTRTRRAPAPRAVEEAGSWAKPLRLGRAAGATTIFNPAPASGLDRETLALADLLTPNRGELAQLAADDASAPGPA